MSKNLNMNAMDKLFSGLSGKEDQASVEQVNSDSESKENVPLPPSDNAKPSNKKAIKKHFCATVDVEKLDKVRAIAEIEGLNINAIVDLALAVVIDKYEELHGAIKIKKAKKGDIKNVFNL